MEGGSAMPEYITKEALAALGAPDLVYIRAVSAKDLLDSAPPPDHVRPDPNAIFYAVHAADGARLAVMDSRQAAFAAARGNELQPVSVH
jgi:hypothetical protein